MSKRKEGGAVEDKLEITPLGAGNEVGRSCVHLTYKGKNVLFDCGIHPAYSGMNALPFFDMIDPSTIDVLLITHFHLDHAASLPYFLEKVLSRNGLHKYSKSISEVVELVPSFPDFTLGGLNASISFW